jgi:hypothetical protein
LSESRLPANKGRDLKDYSDCTDFLCCNFEL